MKQFKTIATTKKGSFDVTITVKREINSNQGIAYWSYSATIIIDGKEMKAEINSSRTDRIYATKEICEAINFPYATNVALHCDIKEAFNYTTNEDRIGFRMLAEADQMHKNFLAIHDL